MAGDNDTPDGDYEVGYGRPPQHTRFKPNRSGNPKGRPRGSQNLKTDLKEELAEHITLREGNREIRISKQRAMVKSLVAKAIKGDQRAAAKAFDLLLQIFGPGDEARGEPDISAEDEAILATFLARDAAGEAS
jgi:hypothetical protein